MHADGFETPEELLDRPEAFFAMSAEEGPVHLVSKAQILAVSCDRSEVPEEDALPLATVAMLEVLTADGHSYRGEASWQLPPAHSRTLDFLNETGAFLTLRTETRAYFINRSHVRVVHPIDH